MQGGDNAAVKEAGLPEIAGRIRFYSSSIIPSDSVHLENNAFSMYEASTPAKLNVSSSGGYNAVLNFRASDSNSIYSNSNTVQPPAIVLIPQIKF